MTRSNPLQGSFNAGEISPRLLARLDFSKYPNALDTCVNMIPLGEGGLMRRPGTRYMAGLKSSAVKGRLKRFEFSTTQAYIIEMGDLNFRFFKDQGQITVQNTDAAITNGTFPSGIASWSDRSTGGAGNQISHDGDNLRLKLETNGTAATDIGWAEQEVTNSTAGEHVLKFQVIGAPSDRIELRIGTASLGEQIMADKEFEVGYHCYAFTATAANFFIQFRNRGDFRDKDMAIDNVSLIDNAAVELQTPYTEAQLYHVNGPQSADLIYLFHPSHPVHTLTRLGHSSWSLIEAAWEDGPWGANNNGLTATTITATAATGLGIDFTASSIVGINDDTGFQSTDVGRLIRLSEDTTTDWGWGIIVSVTSTTVAKVDIRRNVVVTTAEVSWRLGEWSATTGYPGNATFYQQRLYAANTSNQPQTWWASNTADFLVHSPDSANPENGDKYDGLVEDTDALDYTISADQANGIFWMSPGENTLAFGTQGGEWTAGSTGAVITPTDVVVNPATSHGVANIVPLRVDNVALFVQRAKRKVREFGFTFESDGYKAFDMTRLAEHITRGGVVELAFAEEPDSLVWAVREDGQLLSMTFRRQEDVVGWARHIMGGVFKNDDAVISRVLNYDITAAALVDETTDASDAGSGDWTLFPATEGVGDYAAFGFTKTFVQLKIDYASGTRGVGGVVVWEYWDGTTWTALSSVVDGTTSFTATVGDGKTVVWTEPTDWAKRALHGGPALYYVRARITTIYSTNPVLDQGYVQDVGDAVVESVAVIPGTNGTGQTQNSEHRDELWLIVKRTVNGSTVRYVEMMEGTWEDDYAQEDAYYADSLISYDGVAATVLTGYGHLEGESLAVFADGVVQTNKTVASAGITIDTAATVVQAGLPFTHTVKTLKLLAGVAAGTPLGATKQIFAVTFVLLNSHTLGFGPDLANVREVDFRAVADLLDAGVPFYTGEWHVPWDADWVTDPRLVIQSASPTPFTLLGIVPEVDTKELL